MWAPLQYVNPKQAYDQSLKSLDACWGQAHRERGRQLSHVDTGKNQGWAALLNRQLNPLGVLWRLGQKVAYGLIAG
jgi:hypothetical protein